MKYKIVKTEEGYVLYLAHLTGEWMRFDVYKTKRDAQTEARFQLTMDAS